MGKGTGGVPAGLRWPLIVGLPVLTAALAWTLFTPQYQTNDDVAMTMFAAGVGLGAEPSPYLLFLHPLLGQVLSGLYRLWPVLPWYALLMTAVRMAAGIVLGVVVLGRDRSAFRAVLLAGYFLLVELAGYVCPQFSLVAAAAAQAAVLLWLSRGPERPWGLASLAAFLGLLAIGFMVRPDHALLILVLAGPLLALDFLAALRGRGENFVRRGIGVPPSGGLPGKDCLKAGLQLRLSSRLRAWSGRTGGPFLAGVVLLAALQGHCRWFYASSPGWENFHDYNQLRGRCTDLRRGEADPDLDGSLARAGWSRNDLAMLQSFFFADRETYSAARLRAYLDAASHLPPAAPSLWTKWKGAWDFPVLRLLLAAALFPALLLTGGRLTRHVGVCAAVAAAWLLAAGVLHHYCPHHFVQAMLTFAAAAGIALAARPRFGAVRWLALAAGVVTLAVAAVDSSRFLHQRKKVVARTAAEFKRQVRALDPRPDQLFVVWGPWLPLEYLLPLDSFRGDLRSFKMLGLGCATHTPLTDRRLQEFHIDDLVRALYTREDVFLICHPTCLPLLKTYVAEHHGVSIEARTVFNSPGSLFQVHQFRPAAVPSPTPEGGERCP